MGKSSISVAIFNSYVSLPEGSHQQPPIWLINPDLQLPLGSVEENPVFSFWSLPGSFASSVGKLNGCNVETPSTRAKLGYDFDSYVLWYINFME